MSDIVKIQVGGKSEPLRCRESHTYELMPDGIVHKCQHVLKSGKSLYCKKRLARQPPSPCPFKHMITINKPEGSL